VTEGFGNRVDPVHGTETYHPGILIATNPEQSVRAVFEGVVTGIDFVPGYGTYLVIRHGDYLSVYSNFSTLFVSQGDRVDTGEVIGHAGTANEPRGAGLFFAVFDKNKNTSVDPMRWLGGR
jgi:murein DD-endopeptidase MepM/ murein hydrolase activator NlpD